MINDSFSPSNQFGALEEAASYWNQMLTWRIFFCSMTSFMTLNYGLSALKPEESFGNLSSPGLLNFGKFDNVPWYWYEIPIFIMMGIFGGLLGAAFVQMNKCITGKLSSNILRA